LGLLRLCVDIWDIESGERLVSGIEEHAQGAAFSSDGALLLVRPFSGNTSLWDADEVIESGEFSHSSQYDLPESDGNYAAAYSPDGQWIALGQDLRIWDMDSSRITAHFSDQWALTMSFSPDGQLLVTHDPVGDFRDRVHILDVAAESEVLTLPRANYMAFNPAGTLLVTSSNMTLWGVPQNSEENE
jgi:WD40 repeat protein